MSAPKLVFVRRLVRDIPFPLVIAFADALQNLDVSRQREEQRKLYDMYRLSTDASLLNLAIALRKFVRIIFKPEGYVIEQNGTVKLFTKGGTMLVGDIKQFGKNMREIENTIGEWLLVDVTAGKPYADIPNAKILHVEPITRRENVERAKEIMEEHALTPIELLLYSLGIRPCVETVRLYAIRFLSLFFYDARPIHVIQITQPETGKSHYSVRMEFAFNFTHFTEFPSPARLIYDARLNAKGAVFTSNGIVIDEIDKLDRNTFKKAYMSLNTGLENGVWRRGVTSSLGASVEGYRFVPFVLFGNVPEEMRIEESYRQSFETWLREYTNMNVSAFVERFALVDVCLDSISVSRYLIRNEQGIVGFLPDEVLRGVVRIVEDSIEYEYVEEDEECFGRLRTHAEAVYNVLKALLDTDIDADDVKKLILGEMDALEFFGSLRLKV